MSGVECVAMINNLMYNENTEFASVLDTKRYMSKEVLDVLNTKFGSVVEGKGWVVNLSSQRG